MNGNYNSSMLKMYIRKQISIQDDKDESQRDGIVKSTL